MAFYSWRLRNTSGRQNLHLCLETEGECRWCEPFGIESPGVVNRVVHYGLHTATLVIEVKKKSGLQRQVSEKDRCDNSGNWTTVPELCERMVGICDTQGLVLETKWD